MKHRWLIVTCLLAFLLLQMPAMAEPANLLKNSSFETNENLLQPKHWQTEYWSPGGSAALTQTKVYDGNYALVLQSEIENDFRMGSH